MFDFYKTGIVTLAMVFAATVIAPPAFSGNSFGFRGFGVSDPADDDGSVTVTGDGQNTVIIIDNDQKTPHPCFQRNGEPVETSVCRRLIRDWMDTGKFKGLLDGRYGSRDQLTPCFDEDGYPVEGNTTCDRILRDEVERTQQDRRKQSQEGTTPFKPIPYPDAP